MNTGLIENADNASDVAGVMAHEISHVLARHSTEQLSRQIGRTRDVDAVAYKAYEALIGEVANLHPETRRHYASMLLAILNNAKAVRLTSHQLEGVRVPQVLRDDEPEPWTRHELGVLMGPALRKYEQEQRAWNAKVCDGEEEPRQALALLRPAPRPLPGRLLHAHAARK